ncbi:hypothetical protein QWY75_07385 [Pontixanthobacter aestiaquae]|uniref:hypothetical protein n=1 Tax=Pontixanthobacter aestiaquae TaxID=1509367 RepID=UPI0019253225|nr:hypothetical protein [Pontixanthobacter aestiaquae]MDN3646025.1 hypothetical protein [Pontixanthobacter aestiaquae]
MRAGSRLRQIGWAVALSICVTGFVALTFRVNAVKSEVRLAERTIVALEREKLLLETEFQTRANQQQLANWNRVEFGYQAPTADQYLENERELAQLGMPRAVGAPDPIRVAMAPKEAEDGGFPAFVSPLTGQPANVTEVADKPQADTRFEKNSDEGRNSMSAPRSLSERLAIDNPLSGSMAEVSE